MKIAVFGSGGVGGYFGGRLARAGNDVTFIARGEHLRALTAAGLRVESTLGDFNVYPARATDDPTQIGAVEAVILGVKAWQVDEAADSIRPLIGRNTFVLPLQNGVEASSQLAAKLGREHVLGGLCRIVSYVVGPGHIRHAGFEPFVAFGEVDNRVTERVIRLRDVFLQAGIETSIPSDIEAAIWNKFLFITAFSGVGAVTQAPAGVMRRLPQTRALVERAMWEIHEVASARGVRLGKEAVSEAMTNVDSLPDNATSSMQRDIIGHRPSELESQSGAVVRLGREAGVATPVNSFVYDSLLPLELRARGEIEFPS
jgi:2-dehydropantoate 2-reductase